MRTSTHRRFARLKQILFGGALLAALQVSFAAFTMTEPVSPSLGTLLGGASLRQFILNTDETVSGPAAADYLFGAVSGQLSLIGQNGNATIVAGNFSGSGAAINAVPCRYHTGSQTICDSPGITVAVRKNQARILYVGVDLTTSLSHSGGDTASVTYDITVNFI
jgi:hypothetical protein